MRLLDWWLLGWLAACGGGKDTGTPETTGSTTDGTPTATTSGQPTTGTTATTTTTPPYHPKGFADPALHGLEAKLQVQDCTACHGADLAGGSVSPVSCDDCHASGWRTDCVYCHGGVENGTGAPPEDIDDETDAALTTFPPHGEHVAGEDHPAYPCTACHPTPTDALSPGHVFVDDATPGESEVDFSGGIAAGATWDGTATCTNLTCHGDGQGPNGTVSLGTSDLGCGACHPAPSASASELFPMSGEHHEHPASRGVLCSDCHAEVVDAAQEVVGDDLHVDGKPDVSVAAGITWDPKSRTCLGKCHGVAHPGVSW